MMSKPRTLTAANLNGVTVCSKFTCLPNVFMSRPVWPAGHYVSGLSVLPSHFRGTTLRVAPSKNYAFSTNYHACISMPTWPRCAPPILCWPWPPYNLLQRSCLTWFLAPPAERQRSFSNTDLSVVRLSVRLSVRPSVRQDWGGEGSISETLQ